MKSTWDKIFSSENTAPLSEQECEEALREVAEAVAEVGEVQSSPEHARISKLIREKLSEQERQMPQP
jgi:hypothetical protein